MSTMDLDALLAFARTVETGSISGAARALGLSRPAVSRQIATLEHRLGLALFERGPRSVVPTATGRRIYAEASPHLDALSGLEARVAAERDTVSGRLRLAAPPVLGPSLARMLVDLRAEHPALEVELITEIRHVDLRAEGIELAVRAGQVADPELVQRLLGRGWAGAFAAPAYLAVHGHPPSVDALAEHVLLRGVDRTGRPQRWWPLHDGGRLAVDGPFATNDQRALLEAVLAGGGIGMLTPETAAEPQRRGDLVPVLPTEVGTTIEVYAVTTRRTLQPARVRACIAALVRWAATFDPTT